jgi:YbbR domain-containing protein
MRWLYGNLGYKLLAVGVAFLLWGVSHTSSDIERGFDVPVVVRGISDDLVIINQSTDEVNVRIMGSRAALRNLSAAELEYPVEVTGAKPGTLEVDVDLGVLDLPRGARPVSRSPSQIELKLAQRGSKTIRIRLDLAGEPSEGFKLGEIEVDPPRVRVTGAQSEVLRLNEVLTETIDITGVSSDVVREVRVSLTGRNVWLEDPQPVTARIRIEPVDGPEPAAESQG